MENTKVSIKKIEIKNLKSVHYGIITTSDLTSILKGDFSKKSHMLAIYGQNGSGKTSVVDSLWILKAVLCGETLNNITNDENGILNYLSVGKKYMELTFTIFIERDIERYLVDYKFRVSRMDDMIASIDYELLTYRFFVNGKWKKTKCLFEHSMNDSNKYPVFPKYRLKKIDDNIRLELLVAKKIALKENKSFLFSRGAIDYLEALINEETVDGILEVNLFRALSYFGMASLFILRNNDNAEINLNLSIPIPFKLFRNKNVTSGIMNIGLFDVNSVDEEGYKYLTTLIGQLNVVLPAIIPGLQLEVRKLKTEYDSDNRMVIHYQVFSINKSKYIPLQYESDGIKKIISLLNALVAVYSRENVCLVVDELDSGIFEYLLGELLLVLEENSKGQLIFTSHNLRPLEKLNKESLVFTTTDSNDRFIRLKNIKETNNIRDVYLRGIVLQDQAKEIYEPTNNYRIKLAFTRAGREGNV